MSQEVAVRDYTSHEYELVDGQALQNILYAFRGLIVEMRGNILHMQISDLWPNETPTERRMKIQEIKNRIQLYEDYLSNF